MKEISEALANQVAFLRGAFRNDGAEGESVHAVCNAVEILAEAVKLLNDDLERTRREVETLRAEALDLAMNRRREIL